MSFITVNDVKGMDSVSELVEKYQQTRDLFNENEGVNFQEERRTLRSSYCNAGVNAKDFNSWVSSKKSTPQAASELSKRFTEWDLKISKGAIKKSEQTCLSLEELMKKVEAFYEKYAGLLEGRSFKEYTDAKATLREALLPELKDASAKDVANKYKMNDEELIARMQYEWKNLKT